MSEIGTPLDNVVGSGDLDCYKAGSGISPDCEQILHAIRREGMVTVYSANPSQPQPAPQPSPELTASTPAFTT